MVYVLAVQQATGAGAAETGHAVGSFQPAAVVAVAAVFLSCAEATFAQNVGTSRIGKTVDLQAASFASCLAACPRRCEQACFSFPAAKGKYKTLVGWCQDGTNKRSRPQLKSGKNKSCTHITGNK